MFDTILKVVISAAVIVAVSEIAGRYPRVGALLLTLPVVSILAFGFWAIQIPIAYFMAVHLNLGPKGVFIAIAVAESLLATAAILVFRRGNWKTVKI